MVESWGRGEKVEKQPIYATGSTGAGRLAPRLCGVGSEEHLPRMRVGAVLRSRHGRLFQGRPTAQEMWFTLCGGCAAGGLCSGGGAQLLEQAAPQPHGSAPPGC